jgi:bacillolysin
MYKTHLLKIFSILPILAFVFSNVQPVSVQAQSGDGLRREHNSGNGRVSFLGPESGRVLPTAKALGQSMRPQDPAMALAQRYGPEFGLKDAERQLTQVDKHQKANGQLTVKYQQQHENVPVMGGELIVNTDGDGNLYSINGEVSPDLTLSTKPTIPAEQARQAALRAMAKWYQKTEDDFVATEPALWIYDESLLQPSTQPAELVWRMEVTAKDTGLPVRELVLVNAQRGSISLHFNQVDTEWKLSQPADHVPATSTPELPYQDRGSRVYEGTVALTSAPQVRTYTANNTSSLPGTFLCDQTDPNCTAGDAYAKAAHKDAIGVYNFYASKYLRDSLDNNGMTIISTVNYCDPYDGCPYDNAFWDGTQIVYGSARNYPMADDVVAHELTHGVTQYESNLFYYYQSGAINESFSDLWGEYYDQVGNVTASDTPAVRWLMGEDAGIVVRDMSNPPAYGDPDKMTSPLYQKLTINDLNWDNGGVHQNSGINNKAVYLMVDGATFNGKTVTPLGWEKTGAIYYEAQTNLLTSGADYSDLYYALQQACTNLTGQKGITSGDCVEVKDALDAVEMNLQPSAGYNPDAPVCTTAGATPTIVFADDLENGEGNWSFDDGGSYLRWQIDSPDLGSNAQSGVHSLYADDFPALATDATAQLVPVAIPPNAYLHFAQMYGFEYDTGIHVGNFDGGVLEYSTNGGTTWLDAGSLIDYNGYLGTIATGSGNPLAGRSAFVGSSHGYISTRLNLSSLAGQTVMFRWRMGLDDGTSNLGWWVDNIRIYTCEVKHVISGNTGASAVTLSYTDGTAKTATSGEDGSYSFTVHDGWSGKVTPSPNCYTFNPDNRPYSNVTTDQTGQNYAPTVVSGCADVHISVGASPKGHYGVPALGSIRQSFSNMDGGPVQIYSQNGTTPILASERFIYSYQKSKAYAEMIGYPDNQLATEYWFPWYNNKSYSTQLRVGNMGGNSAEVKVYAGGSLVDTFTLAAGEARRTAYLLDQGPLHVVSTDGTTKILASERFIQTFQESASYSEMMGYPGNRLATEYWFPWYNNVTYSTQLRVSNMGSGSAEVKVYAGSSTTPLDSFTLGIGEARRISYKNVDNGPLRVVSTDGATPILASERFILTFYSSASYAEIMGYPGDQLATEYCFPWYNNTTDGIVSLSSQLRVSNTGSSSAQVKVYLAGSQIDSFSLDVRQAARKSYPTYNKGSLCVVSADGTTPILASERFISTHDISASYSEMMGYPRNRLDDIWWFPWYNNNSYETELRIAKP